MSCKHENADHLKPGDWLRIPGLSMLPHVVSVEQLRCLDCGCWLSLGRSNDRVPRCEQRLAEVLADINLLWEPRNHDEMISIAVDDCAGLP